MSSLREQIYEQMNLKETDELLEIWQDNDRVEWSDEAFDIIAEILKERGVNIPEQDEPIYEHTEEKQVRDDEFSEEELRIIDDENPPEFYDPFDVLLTTKRIDQLAKLMIAVTVIYNFMSFQTFLKVIQPYFAFSGNQNSPLVYVLTILLMVLSAVTGIIIIYFPLKALAHILRILMAMEFRSRKGTQPNPLVK